MEVKDEVISDVSAKTADSEKLKLMDSDLDTDILQSQLHSQQV